MSAAVFAVLVKSALSSPSSLVQSEFGRGMWGGEEGWRGGRWMIWNIMFQVEDIISIVFLNSVMGKFEPGYDEKNVSLEVLNITTRLQEKLHVSIILLLPFFSPSHIQTTAFCDNTYSSAVHQ